MKTKPEVVRPGNRFFKVSPDYVRFLRMRTLGRVITVKQALEFSDSWIAAGKPAHERHDALLKMNPGDSIISELVLRTSHQMPSLVRFWIENKSLVEIPIAPAPEPEKGAPVPVIVPAPIPQPAPEIKADVKPELAQEQPRIKRKYNKKSKGVSA